MFNKLEVITDRGSAFITYANEIESKEFRFPVAEMSLIKLVGAAKLQLAVIAKKFLP